MSLNQQLIGADTTGIPLEQYRTLRTNLEFLRSTRTLCSIAVTSAKPNAGKSLTVANLGMAFALADTQVLIIDADLRRPSQHTTFGIENRAGLTAALSRDSDGVSGIQAGPLKNLSILPTGPLPPNPTELLAGGRFESVLERLAPLVDLIIIDTPPVLSYSETAILAHAADGVLFVVRSRQSSRRLDRKASDYLGQSGANLIGAVFNDASPPRRDSYYV